MTKVFRFGAQGRVPLLLCGSGLVALCGTAVAQDQLQEVVVTAQKREQNVQNVPIAITAFTTDTLQARGITDVNALGQLTPNVNLDASAPFSGDSSVLSASIRGIGQDDFAFNLDPGVGVYLDGVYLARTIGANQNLLDVDRIEILKVRKARSSAATPLAAPSTSSRIRRAPSLASRRRRPRVVTIGATLLSQPICRSPRTCFRASPCPRSCAMAIRSRFRFPPRCPT